MPIVILNISCGGGIILFLEILFYLKIVQVFSFELEKMASASETRVSLCGKLGLKPLTVQNILFYYAPVQGVLSYTALSVNVMNPSLVLR